MSIGSRTPLRVPLRVSLLLSLSLSYPFPVGAHILPTRDCLFGCALFVRGGWHTERGARRTSSWNRHANTSPHRRSRRRRPRRRHPPPRRGQPRRRVRDRGHWSALSWLKPSPGPDLTPPCRPRPPPRRITSRCSPATPISGTFPGAGACCRTPCAAAGCRSADASVGTASRRPPRCPRRRPPAPSSPGATPAHPR